MNKATPLPVKTMFILCLVILCEPVAYSLLFPFVYFMVKDFHIAKEEDIGYYVGFITSSFAFAQLCSAMPWGWISDKFGRRPVLLVGLFGNSVSILFFGVSTSLAWCITSRSICGLLNGNNAVAKSVIGEITDETNQGTAFALIGLNYSIGTLIGPMLGGFLTHPAEKMPSIFGNSLFFIQYPYFLPCLCSAAISTFGFFVGWRYLPETCPRIVSKTNNLKSNIEIEKMTNTLDDQDIQKTDIDEKGRLNMPITQKLDKQVYMACISYGLLALQSVIVFETFPLWAVSEPGIGLGFQISQIGIILSSISFFIMVTQLFIYPKLSRRYVILKLYRSSMYLMLPFAWGFPLIANYLAPSSGSSVYLWIALISIFGIQEMFRTILFTSAFVIVNNTAKPDQRGVVNGIAQSCASLARTIGPALGGIIWSWSLQNNLSFPLNYNFIFLVITILLFCCLLHSYFLK